MRLPRATALVLAAALVLGPPPLGAAPTVDAAVVAPLAVATTDAIAPTVEHLRASFSTSGGPQAAHILRLDPAADGLQLEAVLSNDRVTGLETVRSQVLRRSREGHRVVAAINASVWSGPSGALYAPQGLHVQDGELMTGDTVPKVTIGFAADDRPRFGEPVVVASVTLPSGEVVAIDRVNKSRRSTDTVLFTPRWGATTLATTGGVEVVLDAPGVTIGTATAATATVAEVRPGTLANAPLAAGRLVLSADGPDEAALGTLAPGDAVTIQAGLAEGWTDVTHAVAGREWVVRDGVEHIAPRPESADQRHPRTAIGVTGEGRLVVIVVDGRQTGYSAGVTLPELGEILRAEGVVEAINLDGGGSSTFVVRRPGDLDVSLANRPSDGSERPVTNALAFVSTVPTGPLAGVVVSPGHPNVVAGTSRTFSMRGIDAAGNPVPVPAGPVAWTATAPGTIDAGGTFRATTPGTATVRAQLGALVADTQVSVQPDLVVPVAVAPLVRLTDRARVAVTGVPVTVSWSATDVGLGVASFRLRQSVDLGAWTDVLLPAPNVTAVGLTLAPGRSYRFAVEALDRGGNRSSWKTGIALRPAVVADASTTITWKGTWRTALSTSHLHGRTRWATAAGASARLTFTGNQVAWVASTASTRGQARIYVDGAYLRTVDLRAASAARMIVFRHAFATNARHTIEIRAVGTAGRPRIDVDGFVVGG